MGLLARIRGRREPPLEPADVPRSVAIIMDGNSRWAADHGLTVADGHREGTRALRRTVEAAIDLGIESLTVYAFSPENWLRTPAEVDARSSARRSSASCPTSRSRGYAHDSSDAGIASQRNCRSEWPTSRRRRPTVTA